MTPSSPRLPVLPAGALPAAVGRLVTRYPDSAWLDLLALRASGGVSDAAGLVARARAGDLAGTDAEGLGRFGYVLAAEPGDRATLDDVALLLDHAAGGDADLGPKVLGLWLQVLLVTGRLDRGAAGPREDEVEAEHWWAVATDLLSPFRTPAGDRRRWEASFSRPFTDRGLVPLTVADGDGTPFQRLVAGPVDPVWGDQVSVVMPVHDPGPDLLTAVRSVLAQSWVTLEVLLVDDASTRGREHLHACAALDPRVRLLRSDRNGGAYAARNLGLAHARGRYVTFQDADDLAHPQRLERQVRALAASPDAMASVSHAVRATDRLELTALGLNKIATNLSSLLLRREAVTARLGGFDAVRRSGDRELLDRLLATFGDGAVVTLPEPLAVIQLTPGSLSRGDMGFLRRHAARQAYAASAGAWHAEVRAGRESPMLRPPARGPFAAPGHVTTGREDADAGTVDVALLASLGPNVPRDVAPFVAALCGAGVRVGLVELPGPRDVRVPPQPPGDAVGAHLRTGAARWVLPEQHVRSRLALVHDPAAVLVMPWRRVAAAGADDLVVVVEAVDDDVLAAADLLAAHGVRGEPRPTVHWLPADAAVREDLRRRLPGASVLPETPWVATAAPVSDRQGWLGPGLVVGLLPPRGTEDADRAAWERDLVPRDPATTVWCRGLGRTRLAGRPVVRRALPDTTWSGFLGGVDVLVLPPGPGAGTVADVVDAWAHGTLVLAPEVLRSRLGDRAVYLDGELVDERLARLRGGAEADAVRERAAGWVRRHATPEGVLAGYRGVLDAVDAVRRG
ncbi:glycosyltransferase family 2 protein [Phycicoccus sp. BSK3Z-2]|uniref:Glycosyltransferase family 2 protein n=1 Tax=Phycicoccus avicenniae TaxID=2828860 RepID=A0A941D815_9MICO|nr:glycosyltransferase family A protein [Phycicoccus avicenniae]MBR7742202.1 glycosyltransferase family 2 protein [Phycicoccus avicenniae]